ncbi:MAG: hypothetical protein DRJ15_11350 [Bacteroidetes bacterium]|nr:MAG: hypothetical protein DRJ15_11350 [Bacteroidota bacterium]
MRQLTDREIRSTTRLTGELNDDEVATLRKSAIGRAERRVEHREHLRLEIKSRDLLQNIHTAIDTLYRGTEPDNDDPDLMIPLTKDRVASINAAATLSDRLLKKVLPDLKQVEIREDEEQRGERLLESVDLSNRLRIYLQAVEERDASVVYNQVPDFLN